MSKKTIGLIVILLILTIVLVFVALSTKQSPPPTQQTTPKPSATVSPTPVAGHTVLSISPTSVAASRSGAPTTLNVTIDTNGDSVRAVQLEIAYDPKVLTGVTIKPGSFFTTADVLPVGGVDQKTGRITFAVTTANLRDSQSGKGTVAVLSFYPAAGTQVVSTPITLLDKSLVTSPGMGAQSVLKTTSGATVTLVSQPQSALPSTNSAH